MALKTLATGLIHAFNTQALGISSSNIPPNADVISAIIYHEDKDGSPVRVNVLENTSPTVLGQEGSPLLVCGGRVEVSGSEDIKHFKAISTGKPTWLRYVVSGLGGS